MRALAKQTAMGGMAKLGAATARISAHGQRCCMRSIPARKAGPRRFGIKRLRRATNVRFRFFAQGGALGFWLKRPRPKSCSTFRKSAGAKEVGGDAPALASSPITIVEERWAEARPWCATSFCLLGSSSRAPDRTVSTSYMLLFGAARAMGPTVKLHRVFLMKACLFTAEVVSH